MLRSCSVQHSGAAAHLIITLGRGVCFHAAWKRILRESSFEFFLAWTDGRKLLWQVWRLNNFDVRNRRSLLLEVKAIVQRNLVSDTLRVLRIPLARRSVEKYRSKAMKSSLNNSNDFRFKFKYYWKTENSLSRIWQPSVELFFIKNWRNMISSFSINFPHSGCECFLNWAQNFEFRTILDSMRRASLAEEEIDTTYMVA